MKTQLHTPKIFALCSLLLLLCSPSLYAQDYQWQWAKSGGGMADTFSDSPDFTSTETVRDIVVDANNNYYFLANIREGNTNYNGMTITHYGQHDILILAIDCDGEFLWSRTIGGSGKDTAYKLAIDDSNGIYVAVNVDNRATIDQFGYVNPNNLPPVHFSEDDVMPIIPVGSGIDPPPHEGFKTGFLLKYDKATGELLWRKDLQGNISQIKRPSNPVSILVDSNNIIHLLVGLLEGTHLDGTVTVGPGPNETKFFLVKYNTSGDLVGTPLEAPISGGGLGFAPQYTFFTFDEQLNRYYMGGKIDHFTPLYWDGIAFENKTRYLMAIDASNFQEIWRKTLYRDSGNYYDDEIRGIAIDENSNIYLTGKYYYSSPGSSLHSPPSFDGYPFPVIGGSYTAGGIPPFTIKLNSNGEVQWLNIPDGYTNSTSSMLSTVNNQDIAINGDEIAVIPCSSSYIWGDFSMTRPQSHRSDPVVLRLNKQTGGVIGLHDIMGGTGVDNILLTIATDNDGNYVMGGHYVGALFMDNPNNIPTLYSHTGGTADFFITKLAATACGTHVATADFEKSQVKLYPNPTSGTLYIETTQEIQSYEVYNLIGQQLLKANFNGSIDLQHLTKGTYIVKLKARKGEVVTEKVVKM